MWVMWLIFAAMLSGLVAIVFVAMAGGPVRLIDRAMIAAYNIFTALAFISCLGLGLVIWFFSGH